MPYCPLAFVCDKFKSNGTNFSYIGTAWPPNNVWCPLFAFIFSFFLRFLLAIRRNSEQHDQIDPMFQHQKRAVDVESRLYTYPTNISVPLCISVYTNDYKPVAIAFSITGLSWARSSEK